MEAGLASSRARLRERLAALVARADLSDDLWEELEAELVAADVGIRTAQELIALLQGQVRQGLLRSAEQLPVALRDAMIASLRQASGLQTDGTLNEAVERPHVVLVVGVNGSGKTTTVAKLGRWLQQQGKSALLVAADTYRAAAREQLAVWSERLKLPLIAGQPGSDPGAVLHDALHSRAGRSVDAIIVDTAGRLHTQGNLMAELAKLRTVAARSVPGAPHETLLVLDAVTGQNGLAQARAFAQAVQVSGLVLAKLDSSARGGVAFAIHRELGIPIRFVGIGEGADDLVPFDPESYAASLVGSVTVPMVANA